MQIDSTNYINNNSKWSDVKNIDTQRQALSRAETMSTEDNSYVGDVTASNKSEESNKTENDEKEKANKSNKASDSTTKMHTLEVDNTVLKFERHKETGEIMVKIIDKKSGDVIREIPPEKILDSIAQLWKCSGINVDKKA